MIDRFIGVGENIHCTRKYKIGGKYVVDSGNGNFVINYTSNGEDKVLPVPQSFLDSSEWQSGMLRHCAVAISQGFYGEGDSQQSGIDYIRAKAQEQEAVGAAYLDVNVDEFSTDVAERIKLMEWTAKLVQESSSLPLSIDSSNQDILRAGLAVCDSERDRPMLNSVSLERQDAIPLAAEFNAVVVATAAGEADLPSTKDGRLENIRRLVPLLREVGIEDRAMHFDPLVFPMSTDSTHGPCYLESSAAIRDEFGPEVHFVAGLSNISFGMPNRKLLNQVYAYMSVEFGGDGGIVDPLHINTDIINAMDPEAESFKLAKAALTGEDDFGMNYIMACREGQI